MRENMDIDTLLDMLSKNKIIIYGSGHVGIKFYNALKMHHLEKNVLCFAVSHQKEKQQEINAIPVREITKIDEKELAVVCIATHEVLKDEIINVLENKRIKKYIWIYPFLHVLLLGDPVDKNVSVELPMILKTCENDYRFAVRYMAIEQYFGKNFIGYDMYIRAEMLHCSRDTAEKRLYNFCRLLHNCEQFGYDQGSIILINTDYEIIDGNHRVTTARYFGVRKVVCNMFASGRSVTELHGKNAMLTEKVLIDGGFCPNEIESLKETNKIIAGD